MNENDSEFCVAVASTTNNCGNVRMVCGILRDYLDCTVRLIICFVLISIE